MINIIISKQIINKAVEGDEQILEIITKHRELGLDLFCAQSHLPENLDEEKKNLIFRNIILKPKREYRHRNQYAEEVTTNSADVPDIALYFTIHELEVKYKQEQGLWIEDPIDTNADQPIRQFSTVEMLKISSDLLSSFTVGIDQQETDKSDIFFGDDLNRIEEPDYEMTVDLERLNIQEKDVRKNRVLNELRYEKVKEFVEWWLSEKGLNLVAKNGIWLERQEKWVFKKNQNPLEFTEGILPDLMHTKLIQIIYVDESNMYFIREVRKYRSEKYFDSAKYYIFENRNEILRNACYKGFEIKFHYADLGTKSVIGHGCLFFRKFEAYLIDEAEEKQIFGTRQYKQPNSEPSIQPNIHGDFQLNDTFFDGDSRSKRINRNEKKMQYTTLERAKLYYGMIAEAFKTPGIYYRMVLDSNGHEVDLLFDATQFNYDFFESDIIKEISYKLKKFRPKTKSSLLRTYRDGKNK